MIKKIGLESFIEKFKEGILYMETRAVRKNMKLYKFRSLGNCFDLDRIEDIIENGFYCNDFLDFNDMNEGIYNKKI